MKFQMIQMLRFLGIGNVIFARPTDSKKNCSHACWFWVLEMVILFRFLTVYIAKLVAIY